MTRSKNKKAASRQDVTPISSILFEKVRSIFLGIATFLIGWGLPEMGIESRAIPWLVAFGAFFTMVIVVTDPDLRKIINKINIQWVKSVIIVTLYSLCIGVFIITYSWSSSRVEIQEEAVAKEFVFNGYLIPGKEPNPAILPTNAPNNTIIVMLGDKVGVFMRPDQSYIFAVRDEPLVSIGFDESGGLLLNADVFDSENNRIVHIGKGAFQVSEDYGFKPIKPTPNSLKVSDFQDNEVLNVDYINPQSVRISGRFYIKGYSEPFIISPVSNINFGGLHINDTKPFMFDITGNPIKGFLNVTANGGLSLAGNIIGEGSAK